MSSTRYFDCRVARTRQQALRAEGTDLALQSVGYPVLGVAIKYCSSGHVVHPAISPQRLEDPQSRESRLEAAPAVHG